jgi:hypothetical protein
MLYAKIAAIVVALGLAYYKGYSDEHARFMAFKNEVEAIGKAQEAATKHAIEIAEVITESVKDEYETRISTIRNEYARRMRDNGPGRCNLPAISKAAPVVNGSADDPAIIGLCAEETAKLVALQKWINLNMEHQK